MLKLIQYNSGKKCIKQHGQVGGRSVVDAALSGVIMAVVGVVVRQKD